MKETPEAERTMRRTARRQALGVTVRGADIERVRARGGGVGLVWIWEVVG